jgi:DDE family transposase
VGTATAAKPILAQAAMVTAVSDRESDLYPSWVRVPDEHVHVLTRVMSDRCLIGAGEATLHTVADRFPVAGTATLDLPARPPKRAARTAKLELRFGAVEIARPVNEKDRTLPRSVQLRLVEVREVDTPEGEEPLRWLLLTTHAVEDVAKAWLIVSWYKARWTIEQLFRVTKSQGLGLEDSQMETAEGLMKLTAAALKAACIDMQLVQERDGKHGLPASTVFAPAEIITLEALNPTLEGKTDKQKNPHPTHSLAWAGWVIARLGYWHCYGKPPGPITFHRGMERFKAIHQGFSLQLRE